MKYALRSLFLVWLLSFNVIIFEIHSCCVYHKSFIFFLSFFLSFSQSHHLLNGWVTVCFSSYPGLDICSVSTPWPLWVTALWAWDPSLCRGTSFLLSCSWKSGTQACLTFWETLNYSPKWLHRLTFLPAVYEGPSSFTVLGMANLCN